MLSDLNFFVAYTSLSDLLFFGEKYLVTIQFLDDNSLHMEQWDFNIYEWTFNKC
jgi:hypothetical protein